MVFRLAWRNFGRNGSRYSILILATSLVVAALVVVAALLFGVTNAVRDKASRYFSGDVTIHSYADRARESWIRDPSEVEGIIRDMPFPYRSYSRRSVYYRTDATLFFGGSYVNQRRLIGVEWDREEPVLREFSFQSGGLPERDHGSRIIVSHVTARRLGVQVGDQVTLALTTRQGFRNTGQFVVSGIYEESSFFGYVSYLDRETFNSLYGYAPEEVSDIGLYLPRPGLEEPVARYLHAELSALAPTFDIFTDRDERDTQLARAWEGRRYAVSTLDALLAEVTDLISALSAVTVAVILLFAAIVVIGVSNTYSMVVYERTKEIGLLRSLGLTRVRTLQLFLMESVLMGGVATVLGLLLGVAVLVATRALVTFQGQGIVSLFLVQERLPWELPATLAFAVVAFGILACVLGALRPSVRASRVHPVEALRKE